MVAYVNRFFFFRDFHVYKTKHTHEQLSLILTITGIGHQQHILLLSLTWYYVYIYTCFCDILQWSFIVSSSLYFWDFFPDQIGIVVNSILEKE